jgi:hypothetical protein
MGGRWPLRMSYFALAVVWNKWAQVATRVVVSSCRSWFGPQQEGEVCESKADCPQHNSEVSCCKYLDGREPQLGSGVRKAQ